MSTFATGATPLLNLDDIIDRVLAEQAPVVVEYDGSPQVVVLPIKEYERLLAYELWAKAESAGLWSRIEEARSSLHRRRDGRPLPPVEENIRQMRDDRDALLLAHLHGR